MPDQRSHLRQPHVVIRPLVPEDADELSQLIWRNLREVLIADYTADAVEALIPTYAPESIRAYSQKQIALVATVDNKLAGTASLDKDRVRHVYVAVERRKNGVGTALMREIEVQAIKSGHAKIYLMAGLSAAHFYARLGYVTVERIDRVFRGAPLPVIHMEKRLTSL